MNSLFFVVAIGTLSALSLTRAVALPPAQASRNVQGAGLSFASFADVFKSRKTLPSSHSELKPNSNPNAEEYDQFVELYEAGESIFVPVYTQCYGDILQLCAATEGFNASYTKDVEKLVLAVAYELSLRDYYMFEPWYGGIDGRTEMPEVALRMRDYFRDSKKILVMYEKSIEILIGKENKALVSQVKGIFAAAEVEMEAAFQPTREYLAQFAATP